MPTMVAGSVMSFVGSSVVEPKASSPCLCLDSLPSCGDLMVVQRKRLISSRSVPNLGFRSSFVDLKAFNGWCTGLKKHKKRRGFVVVGELAGQYDDTFEDVKRQIVDYFTYKAVRTVLNQLYEMDPNQYRWFYDYVASNESGYGKHFIRNLVKERQNLAERVMVTRLHLYAKWIKKCDHTEMYERISDQNLELMRERLIETIIWPPSDDSNTEELIG